MGGRGILENSLLSRLLGVVAKKEEEKTPVRCSKIITKALIEFFAKLNIEVTRGHKRYFSNLGESSRICP